MHETWPLLYHLKCLTFKVAKEIGTFVLYNFSVKNHFCIARKLKECFDEDNVNQVDKKMGETYDASDTGNDEVIANLLQTQFNREYDTMLKRTEEKFNRDSKGDKKYINFLSIWLYDLKLLFLISVSISYSNYRNSLHDIKDEDNIDSNVDDNNRYIKKKSKYNS